MKNERPFWYDKQRAEAPYTLERFRLDENLRETLAAVDAVDGYTYRDALGYVETWGEGYRLLVEACAIARMSGDGLTAETIREAAGTYHLGLAAGRSADPRPSSADIHASATAAMLLGRASRDGDGYNLRGCSTEGCSAILAYPDEGETCPEHEGGRA